GRGTDLGKRLSVPGTELDLFAAAHNWKGYWSQHIRPFVYGDVLETGAGIGANTLFLDQGARGRWVCLEPDPKLVSRIAGNLETSKRGSYEIERGTLQTLNPKWRFDTIIYIDVLEHIEDDRGELRAAADRLRRGGRAIVLSPAHQSLFTPFDSVIGHYRRYNREMLQAITPPELQIERIDYLDSAGLAASFANRFILRQSMPTARQLAFWDRWMIPVSRWVDPLMG